jgi:excisionase family DNA binding protein
MTATRSSRSRGAEREALFVRIPTPTAERLDRAAFELRISKQDLVSGLVARYVDPASPSSLAALRALSDDPEGARAGAAGRRVTIETADDTLAVGHHDFRPAPLPDVLTVADAAALLQVDEHVVAELAEAGELPGRRVGSEWRFARQAILDWLGASAG